MKIAWFTPLSRENVMGEWGSMIARELRRSAEVTLFASDVSSSFGAWHAGLEVHYAPSLRRDKLMRQLDDFDTVIYNLGNHVRFHGSIYELAMIRPGIVVLHDVVMHHFFAAFYLEHRRDPSGYIDEVAFAHGAEGERLARAFIAGEALPIWQGSDVLRYHMAKSAIHGSEGVVVHSEYARRVLAEIAEAPVVHVSFPTPPIAKLLSPERSRTGPAGGGRLRVLTVGWVNPNKLLAETIAAIASSPFLRTHVVYHVLGQTNHAPEYADRLRRLIQEYRLGDVVFLLGRRSDEELRSYLSRADLVINVRNPHSGEASWSLLEAAFLGKASVVWGHGYYDEFPDDTVAKITCIEQLPVTLETLCADEQERLALGERALQYARQTFSTERYCDQILAFAEAAAYNRPVLRLTDTAARLLSQLGETPGSPLSTVLSQEIAALGADPECETGAAS